MHSDQPVSCRLLDVLVAILNSNAHALPVNPMVGATRVTNEVEVEEAQALAWGTLKLLETNPTDRRCP